MKKMFIQSYSAHFTSFWDFVPFALMKKSLLIQTLKSAKTLLIYSEIIIMTLLDGWEAVKTDKKITTAYQPGSPWRVYIFSRGATKFVLSYHVTKATFSKNEYYRNLSALNPELLSLFTRHIQKDLQDELQH